MNPHQTIELLQFEVARLEALIDLSVSSSRVRCMSRTVEASIERDDAQYRLDVLKRAYAQSRAMNDLSLLDFMVEHIDGLRAPSYDWMRLESGEGDPTL